jgi:hypothetical protein
VKTFRKWGQRLGHGLKVIQISCLRFHLEKFLL